MADVNEKSFMKKAGESLSRFALRLSNMFTLDPLTQRRLERFRSIKRSHVSLIIMIALIAFSLLAELFISNRALIVSYEGKLFFPTYSRVHLGTEFGYDYRSEVDYRQLKKDLKESGKGWAILPVVPYNPYETNLGKGWLPDDFMSQVYIGLAVGRQDARKSSEAADYVWTSVDDTSGVPSVTASGETRYTWLKYATDASGNGLTDYPSKSKKYLGIALDKEKKSESRVPGDYTWVPLVSKKGFSLDGGKSYVWIKFAGDKKGGVYPPTPPAFGNRHFLGTDRLGRDVLARLVYGFRTAIMFSLMLVFITFFIGNVIGILMGLWGGAFDLVFQRIIEIWEQIPSLYMIMIITSIMRPTFGIFLLIMVFFGWAGKTWTVRAMTYRERERDYILAARSMGASTWRIVSVHIFPNILVVILTSLPFAIIGGISSLTALDYLGYGLPAPTPSWGELLSVGTAMYRTAPWILSSIVTAMVLVLVMISFIGEGLRDAFDPKKYTVYK